MLQQNPKTFVDAVDFVTTVGFLRGGDARERLGVPGRGPVAVITDLGVLEPHPDSHELVLTKVHPGVTPEMVVKATGWPLQTVDGVDETPPPTSAELGVLRGLRTAMTTGQLVGVA
jgi:glutaconate CoA-transferase subunit B